MEAKSLIEVEGRQISLSHLDKVFWPEEGYTKADLIKYYADVASYLLPHLKDRPLVFTRYPNGIEGKFFYQKNAPAHAPEWLNTFLWQSGEGKNTLFLTVTEKAGLVWLANQACIEIHPWLSRIGSVKTPDFVIFDLDPSPQNSFNEVVTIALLVKKLLGDLNLDCWVKTSGASGLHIYLPVINRYTYEEIRVFAGKVAAIVNSVMPAISTIERKVKNRGPRIYIDYLQNVAGQTVCAPYSVRPVKGALVSAPVRWEELNDISPSDFTLKNVINRLHREGDLFHAVLVEKQNLGEAMRKLGISPQPVSS